jgi:hypothetical protein
MTPERAKYLTDTADRLAEGIPESQRDRFKLDFIAVMGSLNDSVDNDLAELEAGVTELLVAVYPDRPGPVNETSLKVVNDVRTLIHSFHSLMSSIDMSGIRQLVFASVKHGIEAINVACQQNEHNLRNRTSRTKELC